MRAWCLQVMPSYQIFELEKGKKESGQVTITNTEQEEIQVTPTTKNWFVLPANKQFKSEDWLSTTEKKFVLQPGESKVIHFTASAPKKAVGELVGMVSLRTRSASRGTIEFVMSVAVYVAVKGTEKLDVRLSAFTVTPSTDGVSAGVLLQNTGNVHIRPRGMLKVFNEQSEPLAFFELGKGQPVFPGNTGSFMKSLKEFQLAPGRYVTEIKITDTDREQEIVNTRKKFTVKEDGKIETK